MNTKNIIRIAVAIIVVIFGIAGCGSYVSYNNSEVALRNEVEANIQDLENVYDKMWKIISQKAQISQEYKSSFDEIYTHIMDSRYDKGDGGQDQAALHLFLPQTPPDPHHRQLDDIGGGALDRGVASHALAAGPYLIAGAGKLRQRAAASEQRRDIPAFLRLGNGLVHVGIDFGVGGKVALEEGVRLLDRDVQVFGQAEGALAVHDAEVHGLGRGTEHRGDHLYRHPVDLRGRVTVDILS